MIVKLLLKVGCFGPFGFPQTVYHARKTTRPLWVKAGSQHVSENR